MNSEGERSTFFSSLALEDLQNERERVYYDLCSMFPDGEDLSMQNAASVDDERIVDLYSDKSNFHWSNVIKEAVRTFLIFFSSFLCSFFGIYSILRT